jgi:arsenite methyltransferase
MAEFDGTRAKLYSSAMTDYPYAREGDIELMFQYLKPSVGEAILEIGAGNGFFSGAIAGSVGEEGLLTVSDPSKDQLSNIKKLAENIYILQSSADKLELQENKYDAVWSFGAMHHVFNKDKSFRNFYKGLRTGGE